MIFLFSITFLALGPFVASFLFPGPNNLNSLMCVGTGPTFDIGNHWQPLLPLALHHV
jgi:hypothetical protein